MKSSFLLVLLLCAQQVFAAPPKKGEAKKAAQTQKSAVPAPTAPAAPVAPVASAPAEDTNKSSFDKFYERLSIGYFGAFSSPTLKDFDSRYAAISKEFSGDGTHKDSYSMNLWSQVNFGYNYGGKMKFNVIPRWTTFFDEVGDQKGGSQDNGAGSRGMFQAEDMLVGFSGVILASPDKKFNWWMRPGLRLPTSRNSKNNGGNRGFGHISHQPEVTNVFSYDFDPTWQLALTYQARVWVFEDRYNFSRMRNYVAPYFTYTVNEKTKVQGYYEVMYENNRRWKSINDQDPMFQDLWQNAYVGVAYDVTPKLNVQPFINMFVDDKPIDMDSFWVSVWISYSIK